MKKASRLQILFRLAREEHGTELVEFAMTALVLILLLFGILELMLAMYAYHFTTYAAQEGSRFAMVRGNTWSENTSSTCSTSAPPNFTMAYDCTASASDIQNYVQSLATGGIKPSGVTTNTTSTDVWPGTNPDGTATGCTTPNSKGCMVKVTVSYTFDLVPFMHLTALPITATSEKVILQ
jgi:Flp pilus assembly protein TadG